MVPKSLYRYGLVGVFSNLVVYGLFVVLYMVGLSAVFSAGVCYIVGLILSYVFNRRWSFESVSNHRSDLLRFLVSYGVGFVATLIFITILTNFLRPEVAQIINIGLTAVVIYVCLVLTGFGKGEVDNAD